MHIYPADTWRRHFDAIDRLVFLVAIACGVAFMVLRPQAYITDLQQYGFALLKCLPVISLGLLSLKHVQGRPGVYLAAAMFFSAAGDVTLELSRATLFPLGLAFFLVAHVAFILLFRRDFVYDSKWTPAVALLALYGIGMSILLIPRLGGLLVPVLLYMLVLIGMGIFALYRQGRSMLPFYGALLFIGSDSLIALNKFLPPDASARLIMPTYYAAQFLIACGFLFVPAYLGDESQGPGAHHV